jgi:hypothetical protein
VRCEEVIMADYSGILGVPYLSDKMEGKDSTSARFPGRARITDENPRAGTHSLEVQPRAVHDVYYGADAGSKTISVWVFPPAGGKCGLL